MRCVLDFELNAAEGGGRGDASFDFFSEYVMCSLLSSRRS
jgi:hypothetical protein